MTRPTPDPPESLLAAVERAEGDPYLLPDEVKRLHAAGKAHRARRALLQHLRTERDATRAAKQRRLADDLRLWLEPLRKAPSMHTVNGVGTRLHGAYQPSEDGTYIATLSIALFFLPVFALGAYLVQPAESKDAWHFFARAPLPPAAHRIRRFTGTALAALLGLLFWNVYWSASHAELVVFNGFDRTVVAEVGEQRTMIPPRAHAVFPDLPLDPTTVGASWDDTTEQFERLDLNLADRGRQMAIYNVADRAVLSVDYVLYGEGEPQDGRWLERGPVLFLHERIDYLFETPPDTKKVSEGSRIENSVLSAADDGAGALEVASALFNAGRAEQALAVARAELMAHPDNGPLASFAARVLLRDDFEAQLALLRNCLQRAPDAVDIHRSYQDVWPRERRQEVRREYAARLAAAPRSPMYHYLVGRLEEDGSEAATQHFRASLSLDPAYAPTYRALAYHATVLGRWTEAVAHYDRFAALGVDEAFEALDPRLRIRRRLGVARPVLERLITDIESLPKASLGATTLRAHLRIEARPEAFAEEVRRVHERVAARGWDTADAFAGNVRADLAITAGRPELARRELRGIARPESRSAVVALRLALTAGGTPEDVLVLTGIRGWQTELGAAQRIMALPLLTGDQRRELIATLDPELAEVARLFEKPSALTKTDALMTRLARHSLDVRSGVAYAAARVLEASSDPGARVARRVYLSEARGLALPGELP